MSIISTFNEKDLFDNFERLLRHQPVRQYLDMSDLFKYIDGFGNMTLENSNTSETETLNSDEENENKQPTNIVMNSLYNMEYFSNQSAISVENILHSLTNQPITNNILSKNTIMNINTWKKTIREINTLINDLYKQRRGGNIFNIYLLKESIQNKIKLIKPKY
jgi:hypothetical protein